MSKKESISIIATIRKHWILLICSTLVLSVLIFSTIFIIKRTQSPLKLEYASSGQSVGKPFRLELGQSVAKITSPEIKPKLEGSWRYVSDNFGIHAIEFVPKDKFSAGAEYSVNLSNVTRSITGQKVSAQASFRTEEAPGVLSFSVPAGTKTIAADSAFEIKLNPADKSVGDVSLETNPAVELIKEPGNYSYKWKPKELLPQDTDLNLVVKNTSGQTLLDRTVHVAKAPELAEVSKETDLVPGDTVTLSFSAPVDRQRLPESAIRFDVPGSGNWIDDSKYEFKPENIEPGMSYAYAIAAGLRTKEGGILAANIDKSFSTRGAISIIGVSPTGSELSQAKQTIKITFSQPVNKQSVEGRFSISSGAPGAITWINDSTMSVTVSDLGYQSRVYVNLAAGINPAGFGSASQAWGYSFTTEVRSLKLAVPYYRQAYAQSCEAADVRMALAYRGIGASDWDILQKFGYNPTHKNQEANTWDDPQQQFVGDVNGNQRNGTGWGVYAEPVARAVRSYGRQASTQYGVSAGFLASQIYAGNPVVIWGIWGSSAEIRSWTTPSGGTASGPFIMHVRLVTGVVGEPSNPIGFYVHDPITGSAYWSADQLIYNTQQAGPANQAVVIY